MSLTWSVFSQQATKRKLTWLPTLELSYNQLTSCDFIIQGGSELIIHFFSFIAEGHIKFKVIKQTGNRTTKDVAIPKTCT
jgi:hypothetical protein